MKKLSLILRHLLCLTDLFRCWFVFHWIRIQKGMPAAQHWSYPDGFVRWAKRFLRSYHFQLKINGSDYLRDIPWNSRHVFFLSNHQSYADIPSILAASNTPVGFLAKRELWKIPFLGFWMDKLGCVGVDRTKPSSAIRALKDFEKRGEHKRLVLFPEGTRSKNGQIGEFKDGGLKLVWSLKPIVVSLTIQGSRQGLENRPKAFGHYPIQVNFLAVEDLAEISKEQDYSTWKSSLEQRIRENASLNQN